MRVGGSARVCKLCLYVTLQTILLRALGTLTNQTKPRGNAQFSSKKYPEHFNRSVDLTRNSLCNSALIHQSVPNSPSQGSAGIPFFQCQKNILTLLSFAYHQNNLKSMVQHGFYSIPNGLDSLYSEVKHTCFKYFGLVCHNATTRDTAGICFFPWMSSQHYH